MGEKEHWGKHTPWRNSTQVPFIIVPPKGKSIGDFKPGTKCNQPVNLLDIYPTLVEMANLPKKEGLSGKSLLPLIENPNSEWDEATVTTIAHGNHAIHTKTWSYIHYYDGSEELYNIKNDPEEWVNLAGQQEHKALIEKLKKHIPEDHYKQYIRYGNWKACILHSGEMELYKIDGGVGISEQENVAGLNFDVVNFIQDYLIKNAVSDTFLSLKEERK